MRTTHIIFQIAKREVFRIATRPLYLFCMVIAPVSYTHLLYIRIAKPDNDVLTKNASNTFPYENRELTYSIKKYIAVSYTHLFAKSDKNIPLHQK